MTDHIFHKKAMQAVLESVQSPATQAALRAIELPETQVALRTIQLPATQRLIEEHRRLAEGFDFKTLATEIAKMQVGISPEIGIAALRAAKLSEHYRIDATSPFGETLAGIAAMNAELGVFVRDALRPHAQAHADLADSLASIVPAHSRVPSWKSLIGARVGSLSTAWLSRDISSSLLGFTHLARMREALRVDRPFSEPVVELYDEEFGAVLQDEGSPEERDSAAIEEGFNPGLIAFRHGAMQSVIISAGFEIHLPAITVPPPIENDDPTLSFNDAHDPFIKTLEHLLRAFLKDNLEKMDGGQNQHVPGDLMKRWKERQKEDRDAHRPVFEPIYYADFMDIAQILRGRLVYNAFGHLLGGKSDVQVSLERLHPIRKALAHGRPIGRVDQVLLVLETSRLLTALGCEVLR